MTSQIKGFKILNLEFTFNNEKQARQLFVQKHSARRTTEDKPIGKTLFVLNVPPYISEPELRSAFGNAGKVENVILSEKAIEQSSEKETRAATNESKYFGRREEILGYKVAYIVYQSTKSLEKLLKMSKIQIKQDESSSILCTGISKWMKNYMDSLVDEKELQAEVDENMQAFEAREQEEREESKKAEVDEDGWTVVKRGKAGGGFQQKESVLKAIEEKVVKGKSKKEFKNFYAFQIRESKQKHIVSLRKKFQEDKLKIEALKKARRFKPF